jgi:phosphate uptake regulator
MAENTLHLKEPVNKDLLEKIGQLSILANTMFENSIEALFKHDFNLSENVLEKLHQAHKFEKEAILLTHGSKLEEIANIRLLIESVRRIAEYASDISEVVLNMTIESVLN